MPLGDYIGPMLTSGAVFSVVTVAVQNFSQRRKLGAETEKTDADTADILSKTALALVEPLGKRIKELEEQLDRVQQKAESLEQQLDECRTSNRAKDEQIWMLRRTRASNERELP
ncbi:hypothetical protein [Blastococcus sp. CT_GayMR16]|uniref:hypothetical protein n=1 Tax=Blastococcus sp. CT_GayMR16 TaxID=2559607 RepID=UPI00107393BD|nr:hypothetical protein [Blastococcus sp. CT_GayMR16]TFV90378.1 hypothetical protein E4P38_02760 [Blastococcus sp. CT_GayMR16]